MTLINFYYTMGDVLEYIQETEPALGFDADILNPNPERHKLRTLKDLNSFYAFATPCYKAVKELENIICQVDDLDSEEVRNWVNEFYLFFKTHLFLFGHLYQDEDGNHDKHFYLRDFNMYIQREPFIPIIQFWYLMDNLYSGQYHLPKDDRKFTPPNPNDYYYREPDPNAPEDIEVIKQILQLT